VAWSQSLRATSRQCKSINFLWICAQLCLLPKRTVSSLKKRSVVWLEIGPSNSLQHFFIGVLEITIIIIILKEFYCFLTFVSKWYHTFFQAHVGKAFKRRHATDCSVRFFGLECSTWRFLTFFWLKPRTPHLAPEDEAANSSKLGLPLYIYLRGSGCGSHTSRHLSDSVHFLVHL